MTAPVPRARAFHGRPAAGHRAPSRRRVDRRGPDHPKGAQAGASVHVAPVTLGDAFGYAGRPPGKGWPPGGPRAWAPPGAGSRCGRWATSVSIPGTSRSWAIPTGAWPPCGAATGPENRTVPRFTPAEASPYDGTLTPAGALRRRSACGDLTRCCTGMRPTLCVYPHPQDAARDHAVASAFCHLRLEGSWPAKPWTQDCRRLYYVVHDGSVAESPGSQLPVSLEPPPSRWQAWASAGSKSSATNSRSSRKYQAILMYRSQIPPLGRFLTSFVRRTSSSPSARRGGRCTGSRRSR